MKKTLSISFIVVLMALGCKKNNESPDTGSKDTYQPVTKGSYWKYINPSTGEIATTNTMTGATTVVNGRVYHEYKSVEPPGRENFGHYYSENGMVMTFNINGEVLMLKDGAAVGESWVSVTTPTYSLIAKTLEKGITYVVSGRTFTNVIHIKTVKQYSVGATDDYYDYYFAKGVGLIERKEPNGAPSLSLSDYSIK